MVIYQSKWRQIPEHSNLSSHCHETLTSHTSICHFIWGKLTEVVHNPEKHRLYKMMVMSIVQQKLSDRDIPTDTNKVAE
jgi:hypothetical protein